MIICKITGEKIDPAGGWFGKGETTLSEEGVEFLIKQYIDRKSNLVGFGTTLFIHNLYNHFCRKKHRVNDISIKTRKYVMEKYNHSCAYCGRKERLEIDHIYPVSRGGKSLIPNLQVLCKSCNIKKSNKV